MAERRLIISILLAGLLGGCGSTAPPPFTAEQIRDATRPGRTYLFRLEQPGKAPVLRRMRFTAADATHATLEGVMLDPEGKPLGPPRASRVAWAELVAHATYPRDGTTISAARVTVPAGTYEALLYTVEEDKPAGRQITRAFFAKALPGAPVRHVVSINGKVVSRMTLLKYIPGGDGKASP